MCIRDSSLPERWRADTVACRDGVAAAAQKVSARAAAGIAEAAGALDDCPPPPTLHGDPKILQDPALQAQ
eukprot:5137324-Alexandrium_andersonii.AAC.1